MGMISMEYFVENGRVMVELWLGVAREAVSIEEFYEDSYGSVLLDADMEAYRKADICGCEKYEMGLFESELEWFKCVIKNNFAVKNDIADSTHYGSIVNHIPENGCKYNKK